MVLRRVPGPFGGLRAVRHPDRAVDHSATRERAAEEAPATNGRAATQALDADTRQEPGAVARVAPATAVAVDAAGVARLRRRRRARDARAGAFRGHVGPPPT